MLEYVVVSTIMVAVLAPVAYRVRFLDASGTLVAAAMGLCVGYTMGPVFLGVLVVFLVLNGLFTKMGYVKKALLGAAEPKGGARTWRSVVANGLVATVFAVLGAFFPSHMVLLGFMGAIASASADTASTEVGLLSGSKPRLITSLAPVEPGVSGGVTPLGLLGGLVGALSIGFVGLYAVHTIYGAPQIASLAHSDPFVSVRNITRYAWAITVGGFVGGVADSLLGATLQAKYVCSVCGKATEKAEHCGARSRHIRGLRRLDNDMVNLVATFFGALVSIALFAL